MAEEAVELAVKTWDQRSLTELEAEDRLSYSCEKVKSIEDAILSLQINFNFNRDITQIKGDFDMI